IPVWRTISRTRSARLPVPISCRRSARACLRCRRCTDHWWLFEVCSPHRCGLHKAYRMALWHRGRGYRQEAVNLRAGISTSGGKIRADDLATIVDVGRLTLAIPRQSHLRELPVAIYEYPELVEWENAGGHLVLTNYLAAVVDGCRLR